MASAYEKVTALSRLFSSAQDKESFPPGDLDTLLALAEGLTPGSKDTLTAAITSVVARAIETRILTDPALRRLALYWDSLFPEADDIVHATFQRLLGLDPRPEWVSYVKACVGSHVSRTGESRPAPEPMVQELLRNRVTQNKRLSCEICGYQFTVADVGEVRRLALDDLAPEFADTIDPRRLEDELKPVKVKSKSMTTLAIDHRTPQFGFGFHDLCNLQVTCHYCNFGKLIYRWPLEPISVATAASLSGMPNVRSNPIARQIAVVSTLRAARRCGSCGRSAEEVELTLSLPSELKDPRWLLSCHRYVTCYDCWDSE